MTARFLLTAAAAALASTAVSAADLPYRSAPPAYAAPLPVFTWTGFHVGTVSTYVWSDRQPVRTLGNAPVNVTNVQTGRRPERVNTEYDDLAGFGGGIGYDYQINPGNGVVIGVAADATQVDIGRRQGYVGPALAANGFTPEQSAFRNQLGYIATVRGRVGYAFDRVLVYGTGGFAFGDTTYRVAFNNAAGQLAYAGQSSDTSTGYVYGGGVEYAIPTDSFLNRFNLLGYLNLFQSSAVTLKAEYLHYDLGSRNVVVPSVLSTAPGSYTSRFTTEGNLIRGGFTYRFGTL